MFNANRFLAALLLCAPIAGFAADELYAPPGISTQLQARTIPYARCDLFDVADGGSLTSAIQRTSSSSMKFTWVDPVP